MKICYALLVCLACLACENGPPAPDVSDVKVDVQLQRFDKDLFALDTAQLETGITQLQQQYGTFLTDYLYNIMVLPPEPDSVVRKIAMFLRDYDFVFKSAQTQFGKFEQPFAEIKKGLQYVHHYFPNYSLPARVITFIGPVEGYANVLTESGLAVGLQLYLGKDFPVYQSEFITQVYPAYQQRRFEAAYIPVNCMKNIISDIYPEKTGSMPLAYAMIDAGKRLYLLDHFLPGLPDTLKTGYTQAQLDDCFDHEAEIWNYFVQNNLLFNTDPMQTREYLQDGPYTQPFGDGSPGFIGQFVGWQMVKKWMENNPGVTLETLLNTPEKQVYDEARYKPR